MYTVICFKCGVIACSDVKCGVSLVSLFFIISATYGIGDIKILKELTIVNESSSFLMIVYVCKIETGVKTLI